jgi:hypothetical protein
VLSFTPKPFSMKIVNIIPQSMSGETHQDSSPNIAVNPSNTNEIVISSLTAGAGVNAPVFVSSDGGANWALKNIVPASNAGITLKYGDSGNELYAAVLNGGAPGDLDVLRTTNPAGGATMAVLDSQQNPVEQPYVAAVTVPAGPDTGKDRLYIGLNDLQAQQSPWNSTGQTATIRQTLDAKAITPVFTSTLIDKRTKNVGALQDLIPRRDGPQVRPAVNKDGTVYAVFYSWKTWGDLGDGDGLVTGDVVIVRDEGWGKSANPYTSLLDTGDGQPGQRIAIDVPLMSFDYMGQERIGGELAIAVDPSNCAVVYVVWSEFQDDGGGGETDRYLLHLRKSSDGGQTWSSDDLLSVANGKNPGLAINDKGQIGFLYQQYTGDPQSFESLDNPAGQRWETHLRFSANDTYWSDLLLATVPADTPVRQFFPYIGDYADIMAVGDMFYGVFCANNTPSLANFPYGVTYLRKHHFATQKLFAADGVTPVAPSIDPFFFKTGFVQTVPKPNLSVIADVIFILFGIIQDGGGVGYDGAGHIHIIGPDPGPLWGYLLSLAEYRLATESNDRAALEMQKLALQNIVKMANAQLSQINGELG